MTQDDESEDDVADAAALWLEALKTDDRDVQQRFGEWLTERAASPLRVQMFLEMAATEQDIARVQRAGLIDAKAGYERALLEARLPGDSEAARKR